jgi:hypothetical protein
VAADVRSEKVSAAAGRTLYGVVLGLDGEVDGRATADLRRGRVAP